MLCVYTVKNKLNIWYNLTYENVQIFITLFSNRLLCIYNSNCSCIKCILHNVFLLKDLYNSSVAVCVCGNPKSELNRMGENVGFQGADCFCAMPGSARCSQVDDCFCAMPGSARCSQVEFNQPCVTAERFLETGGVGWRCSIPVSSRTEKPCVSAASGQNQTRPYSERARPLLPYKWLPLCHGHCR